WLRVGGVNPDLRYSLDWDLLRRIAQNHPAVLINEFLAVRQKRRNHLPSVDSLSRALEIFRLAQPQPGKGLPVSHCHALLAGLSDAIGGTMLDRSIAQVEQAIATLKGARGVQVGHADGFPVEGDRQDVTYLPLAATPLPRRPDPVDSAVPSFSIVTPSYN